MSSGEVSGEVTDVKHKDGQVYKVCVNVPYTKSQSDWWVRPHKLRLVIAESQWREPSESEQFSALTPPTPQPLGYELEKRNSIMRDIDSQLKPLEDRLQTLEDQKHILEMIQSQPDQILTKEQAKILESCHKPLKELKEDIQKIDDNILFFLAWRKIEMHSEVPFKPAAFAADAVTVTSEGRRLASSHATNPAVLGSVIIGMVLLLALLFPRFLTKPRY